MIQKTLNISQNTFIESIRRPIYMVVLGLGIAMLVLELFFAAYTFDNDNKLLIEFCLSTIFLGGVAMAALIATDVLYREIDNKTVLTVISKPIGRPLFIFGKFVGVTAAISMAFWVWSIVVLLLLRHQVMSTASDRADMPVIFAGCTALILSVAIATWGNYFYNWVFTSRLVVLFTILITMAYLFVLMLDKQWQFQSIATEFLREDLEGRAVLTQVILAMLLVYEGMALLCAIAIACSTRLGMVLTLVICLGIFVLGSFSDYAFKNAADTNWLAWIAYTIVPNISFFFLGDALVQQSEITLEHFFTVSIYMGLMTMAALCVAVALFQTREIG
jgi:ABC-type transport system involved in multi-copper enzyme maturation permease subunit